MQADRSRLIKAIHVAKRAKGLDEDTYRGKLQVLFGKTSSTELSDAQLGELLTDINGGRFYRKSGKPYVRKIFAMWGAMGRARTIKNASRQALKAFVKRVAGVDDPEFLLPAQANKVIEALKAMEERADAVATSKNPACGDAL